MTARVAAPWASDPARSRGRRHAEQPSPERDAFQHDRDRIVHCSAFRRLLYKTQVFVNHEGDLYRTRLTHSLEVAQLGRSMARRLALNEDLVEALALAHDLGHTPFGHAGQDALHAKMAPYGGFEHNLQSLRVVDRLEQRYADFDGLNLSFETREGILKHCSARNAQRLERQEPGGVAHRFLAGSRPSLEAQLTDLADALAYHVHDLDDGLRAGLLELDALQTLPLLADAFTEADRRAPALAAGRGRRWVATALRALTARLVDDAVHATQARIGSHAPADADAARALPVLVGWSNGTAPQVAALASFMLRHLYRHPQVAATSAVAQQVVRNLFDHLVARPDRLPAPLRETARGGGTGSDAAPSGGSDMHMDRGANGGDDRDDDTLPRRVADYLAGMTDRYARQMHRQWLGTDPFVDADRPA